MPSIWENIAYFFRRTITPNKRVITHIAKWVGILVCIALALEVFVFNFNYFASAGYSPINLKSRIQLTETADETFRITAANNQLEFTNLNTEIHNIFIDFASWQPAQNVPLKIQFTDTAHITYFDSTEYTVGVPVVNVATNSLQSKYINLSTNGLVDNLKIEIVGEDVQYPLRLNTVVLNAHHPFIFNGVRFIIVLGVLLLAFMFRPKSAIYRLRIVEHPRRSKAGIIAANVIEAAIITALLFYGSNLVGIATANYNQGEWDGHSIVNTYEVGGDNAQQYSELAKSFTQGKLYLEEEPPQWLQDMEDPYDKGARDEAQKETGDPYLFDVAYYEGHYYVYFGVVPALLFYLPFYVLTGQSFPTAIGVLIAVVAFVLGCSAMLDRFARYHFKRVSLGIYLLVQIPLVFCCGILYLVKFPTFYSLPIACAMAFSVWGLYFWIRARESSRRCLNFAIGSLCMALVAGCRPQFLLLSLLAIPLFWRIYIRQRRILTRDGMREVACLLLPYVVVAAGIMWYNYARFGSFTDFGANYNLTMNDMTKRGWVLGRFAPAFFSYFLQPPNVCGVFPFIQPAEFATTYMGQTIKEVTFGGVFACLPVLWMLFFAAPIVRLRNAQRSTNTITGVIITLLVSAVVIALVDAQMAGILQRYYADFSFMLLAAVVLLVFIVNENITDNPLPSRLYPKSIGAEQLPTAPIGGVKMRSIITCVLLALAAISVTYSLLLCFVPETGWYSDVYPWAYQELLETFLFWT
ncbi:cytochrome C oxidase Cbb3 [Adlercreutzia sp. ZJ304]|uniref:cytochrome C oxidase Cbb3 n=1 Tax=Adlercreutzia sp. ZJ304 TaxID=2709791 RepID=UPI0013EA1B94|nr:cytochrome C oxidase Cbb3 [Adlercreutzia sp. ZJ304]